MAALRLLASGEPSLRAAPPAQSQPARSDRLPGLRKLIDTPLRDTSICRGHDGTWYLTGTVEPFWGYNEGIKVWKSKDLAAWEPLGLVWKYGTSPWHKPHLEKKKPLWAPEIHFLNGPYPARYEALPHVGHNTFFKDVQGQWWSTYFGSDGSAPWQERPGLLPITFDADGRVRVKLP